MLFTGMSFVKYIAEQPAIAVVSAFGDLKLNGQGKIKMCELAEILLCSFIRFW